MYRFIETLAYDRGVFIDLDLHQKRIDNTYAHFGYTAPPQISQLDLMLPVDDRRYKFRMEYGPGHIKQQFLPYRPKPINKLWLVESSPLDYGYKFADRRPLDALLNGLEQGWELRSAQERAFSMPSANAIEAVFTG